MDACTDKVVDSVVMVDHHTVTVGCDADTATSGHHSTVVSVADHPSYVAESYDDDDMDVIRMVVDSHDAVVVVHVVFRMVVRFPIHYPGRSIQDPHVDPVVVAAAARHRVDKRRGIHADHENNRNDNNWMNL